MKNKTANQLISVKETVKVALCLYCRIIYFIVFMRLQGVEALCTKFEHIFLDVNTHCVSVFKSPDI